MFTYTVYINIIGACLLLTLVILYDLSDWHAFTLSVYSDWVVYHVHLRHGTSVCWHLKTPLGFLPGQQICNHCRMHVHVCIFCTLVLIVPDCMLCFTLYNSTYCEFINLCCKTFDSINNISIQWSMVTGAYGMLHPETVYFQFQFKHFIVNQSTTKGWTLVLPT